MHLDLMADDTKSANPRELHVRILKPLDSESRKKKEDCLVCRVTGSIGLFFISVYTFANVRKQTSLTNKRIVSLIGAGKLVGRRRDGEDGGEQGGRGKDKPQNQQPTQKL